MQSLCILICIILHTVCAENVGAHRMLLGSGKFWKVYMCLVCVCMYFFKMIV
jgi:hypothetical protein